MEENDNNIHDHIHNIQDPEEAEEALSLSELPLNPEDQNIDQSHEISKYSSSNTNRRYSSEPPEFFEFFSDLSSGQTMCSAEDIFFCGRLIPFKEQSFTDQTLKLDFPDDFHKKQTAFRRRSESLSELQSSVARSSSTKAKMIMRNSRSLDYQKLRRSSNSMVSPAADIERNTSAKSVGKNETSPKKPAPATAKPRWSFLMFGMAKFPAEMDLSDIKSRQVRRNPSTLFPPLDSAGGNFPVSRSSGAGKASWKLLKALSCKDHASVAVTASLCVPHV